MTDKHQTNPTNVAALVEALKAVNVQCTYRVRKLASGDKIYFTIAGPGSHSFCYGTVIPIVKKHYPHAHTTSGGFMGTDFKIVVAEY